MTDTREVAGLALKVARADAIHRYVSVEQSLCSLLAKMLSIPDNEAGIIFFNIVAANSRDKIMERLIEKRLAPEYWPFFNGIRGVPGILPACLLFFSSSPLPETNRSLGRRGERRRWAGPVTELQVPPNIWGFLDDKRSLTVEDMEALARRRTSSAAS